MTRITAIGIALLFVAACGGAQTTDQPEMADMSWDAVTGTWVGMGVQVQPEQNWAIEVTFLGSPEGDSIGYVNYPDQQCGGHLQESEVATEDGGLVAEETISYGRDRCFSGGVFRFSFVEGASLTWEWVYPDGAVGATGELEPSSGQPTSMPQ